MWKPVPSGSAHGLSHVRIRVELVAAQTGHDDRDERDADHPGEVEHVRPGEEEHRQRGQAEDHRRAEVGLAEDEHDDRGDDDEERDRARTRSP